MGQTLKLHAGHIPLGEKEKRNLFFTLQRAEQILGPEKLVCSFFLTDEW